MSTQNIQFHDKNKKIYLNICFHELLEKFSRDKKQVELAMVNNSHWYSSYFSLTVYENIRCGYSLEVPH